MIWWCRVMKTLSRPTLLIFSLLVLASPASPGGNDDGQRPVESRSQEEWVDCEAEAWGELTQSKRLQLSASHKKACLVDSLCGVRRLWIADRRPGHSESPQAGAGTDRVRSLYLLFRAGTVDKACVADKWTKLEEPTSFFFRHESGFSGDAFFPTRPLHAQCLLTPSSLYLSALSQEGGVVAKIDRNQLRRWAFESAHSDLCATDLGKLRSAPRSLEK